MRTQEELREIVCNIVKFSYKKNPHDLETMVICIQNVKEYEVRARKIIDSLMKKRVKIRSSITQRTTEITKEIVMEGRQIRREMETLVKEFLKKECIL